MIEPRPAMTKKDLQVLAFAACARMHSDDDRLYLMALKDVKLMNKTQLIEALKKWRDRHAVMYRGQLGKKAKQSLCEIPASECNEFLRGLPPLDPDDF